MNQKMVEPMRVFISWSGERSKSVAVALRNWLPLVLHFTEPWISEKDISAGDRWAVELCKELEGSQFGVIVLTRDNLDAPWVLFEAGALSNALSAGAVCPYLVGLEFRDVSGPLSQFQAKKADRQSTLELIQAINSRANQPLDSVRVLELFEALWPKFEAALLDLPPAEKNLPSIRSQAEVLEELVEWVRRMDSRLDLLPSQINRLTLHPTDQVPESLPKASVNVAVAGCFPAIGDTSGFALAQSKDVVEDIADVVDANIDEYGKAWWLREAVSGYQLSREDGARYAYRSRRRPVHLIVSGSVG